MNDTGTQIKNLVFEGGGVKGIAYAGSLSILEESGLIDGVTGYAGTSAGAITACLCAAGLKSEDVQNILWDLDFNNFKDESFGVFRDSIRLLRHFGWCKGEFFSSWLSSVLEDHFGMSDPTFEDIHNANGNHLRLIGSNLSTGFSEVFSYDTTPDMSVVFAARISMSIPLFFAAVPHNGSVYVDGGLFRNYPIRVFDDDFEKSETLGFRLDSPDEITTFKSAGTKMAKKEIVDFQDYLISLVSALMDVQQDRHLHSEDWGRTIYVNTGSIRTTQFDLTDDEKNFLVEQGQKGSTEFINNIK